MKFIIGTPVTVWIGLVVLLFLGYRLSQERIIENEGFGHRLIYVPMVVAGINIYSVKTANSIPLVIASGVIGFVIALLLFKYLHQSLNIFTLQNNDIHKKANFIVLFEVMGIFLSRYIFSLLPFYYPSLEHSLNFLLIKVGVINFFIGILCSFGFTALHKIQELLPEKQHS
ncbi:hypothetical protein ESZ54_10810 [Vagococcus silagei]|uniref:DUF1453 family protein n=2 Tax=Vagococcus silagei TaxID=2508885 RepID=A0A4S3B415_9ENTE|nr:hypothetical protein ESZ54_10810 [Vagococcus silagei]